MTFPPSLEQIENWDDEVAETGGGSWWETTATGAVTISPSADVSPLTITGFNGATSQLIEAKDFDGNYGISVRNDGGVFIDANPDPGNPVLNIAAGAAFDDVFTIGTTGAVTISPSDDAAVALTLTPAAGATALGNTMVAFQDDTGSQMGFIGADGTFSMTAKAGGLFSFAVLGGGGEIIVNDTGLGFFGATAAAQPTGVAVNAAGIHAALVTLGLIAA